MEELARLAQVLIPRLLAAAARELRDRWLERVNDDRAVLESARKYDVSRAIATGGAGVQVLAAAALKALPHAA